MDINSLKTIYFVGIGGIGMSAIARYMLSQGVAVYGYDKTETSLTRKLEDEGMVIHYSDEPRLIPSGVELVVYTPAIPADHRELTYFMTHGYTVMKRAQMLGLLSESRQTIAVAGTHGKTSTSSAIAHVLTDAGIEVSAFVGGIMANYSSNYIGGSGDWIVVEADEFDRSFLWLQPNIAVVMSMDADHLDIYGEHADMVASFNEFVQRIAESGTLIIKHELLAQLTRESVALLEQKQIAILTFGTAPEANIMICKVDVVQGRFDFALLQGDVFLNGFTSTMPGRHNVENCTAAVIAAMCVGAEYEGIRQGLASFKGISRRFEKIVDTDGGVTYIDDYAHHPTELRAAIGAARELYTDRRIVGIFQPHLYSRTRDFADGFAEALDELDDVVLLPIYPAREEPMAGVTSELILAKMKNENKCLVAKKDLMATLQHKNIDVIMTLGAGDIDVYVPQIRDWLLSGKKLT